MAQSQLEAAYNDMCVCVCVCMCVCVYYIVNEQRLGIAFTPSGVQVMDVFIASM